MEAQGVHEDSPWIDKMSSDLAHGYTGLPRSVLIGYDAYDQDISPDQFDDDELQAMDASMSFCEPCGTDPTRTDFP
jgi:hypothetical protein